MDYPKNIRPHGNRTQIRFKSKGKEYTLFVAGTNRAAIARAIQVRDEAKARLKLGLSIIEEEEAQNATFEEVAREYLSTLEVEHSTAVSYVRILNRFWLPAFKDKLITDIKPNDIIKRLAEIDVTRKTKRNAMGPLRRVFVTAIQMRIINTNPCEGVTIKKHQRPPPDPFSIKEKERILKASQQLHGENDQFTIYLTFLFATGMRPGEALGLTWPDYDGKFLDVNKSIILGKFKPSPKNGERRKVYVVPHLRKLLNEHSTRFTNDYIFVNAKGTPFLYQQKLNEKFRKVVEISGVRYRRPYNCRHTYASDGLSNGLEPAFLADQLGHTLEVFYRTYAHWLGEDKNQSQYEMLDNLDRAEPVKMRRVK